MHTMNILFETDKLRIEYEFENAYLIEKNSGKELMFDDFYGEPKFYLLVVQKNRIKKMLFFTIQKKKH